MPRNVRNFWVEADIEGRASKFASGPRSRTGGLSMEVSIREKGSISDKRVVVEGYAMENKVRLVVIGKEGDTTVWTHEIVTER